MSVGFKQEKAEEINSRLEFIEEKLKDLQRGLIQSEHHKETGSQIKKFDEIELSELIGVIWKEKLFIIVISLIFAMFSIVYSLSQPNIYRARALLAPSEESQGGGLAGIASQLGGLASLAGVKFGVQGDKTIVAIEVMKSRQFIDRFITKYDLVVPIIAAEGWDLDSSQLIIDKDIYDEGERRWVRNVSPPKQTIPTSWEAYEIFMEMFSVVQDKQSGLVTVAIEHVSPVLAKEWVTRLVVELNDYMREKDVSEATKSIAYLTSQINNTAVADMHLVFSQLIEEQTKTMMLAEVRKEYVFSTIDPAVIPEEKVSPMRALICIVGVFLGGLLGVIIVVIRNFVFHR